MVTNDSTNNVNSLSQRFLRYRHKIGNFSASVAQDSGDGQKAERNETIAASARKGSVHRYGTGVDAEERLRQKNMTRTPPRKEDPQSLLKQPSAAVQEKDDETAQPLLSHVKYEEPGDAQFSNYEARKGTSKIESAKITRNPVVAVGGWESAGSSRYNKRFSCHERFWNSIATNCQWYRCRSREEAHVSNSVEEDERTTRSVGISVQQFSENERPADQDEDEGARTLEGLPAKVTIEAVCDQSENSSGLSVRGQEVQTVSAEDLVFLDAGDETINCPILGHTKNSEEAHRIVEHESKIHSRTSNVEKKFLRSPNRCTRRKCSRCSQLHSRYVQIFRTRPERICRKIQPRMQDIRYLHNYKVSLDAFRPPKRRPITRSSIVWKVAAAIYEISGILKDGIAKLLQQDQVSEGSRSADDRDCTRGDACRGNRNVSTGVERSVSCANCSRWAEETPQRWAANCKIPTGSCSHHSDEKGKFRTTRGEDPQNVVGAEWAAPRQKNTFTSKTTASRSSISSLSSSSSFEYSCSAADEERVVKQTENHARQESQDYRNASATESTTSVVGLTMSEGNSTSSAPTVRMNRNTSQNEVLESYDGIDARNLIDPLLADVEDMPGDKNVFSTDPSWVLAWPEESNEIEDSGKSPDPTGQRKEYSSSNRQRQLARERIRKKLCLRNGSGYQEGVTVKYNSDDSSGTDRATSSNGGSSIKRSRRKLKLSVRTRRNSSRLSCQQGYARQNCAVKKITSKTYCKSEQPYETPVQSYLEYFKEVELDEGSLEPALPGPPCYSKIPRLVRQGFVAEHVPMTSNLSRYKYCASDNENTCAWGGEHERTAANGHHRTRISSSGGPSHNVTSPATIFTCNDYEFSSYSTHT